MEPTFPKNKQELLNPIDRCLSSESEAEKQLRLVREEARRWKVRAEVAEEALAQIRAAIRPTKSSYR